MMLSVVSLMPVGSKNHLTGYINLSIMVTAMSRLMFDVLVKMIINTRYTKYVTKSVLPDVVSAVVTVAVSSVKPFVPSAARGVGGWFPDSVSLFQSGRDVHSFHRTLRITRYLCL